MHVEGTPHTSFNFMIKNPSLLIQHDDIKVLLYFFGIK